MENCIKELRKERKISQEELAQAVSVTRQTIISLENGKYNNIFGEDLFDIYTKEYVVVTFLAILNLAKNGELLIKQDRNLDSITLSAKGEV